MESPGQYVSGAKKAKWLVESALVPLRFFQERCEVRYRLYGEWERDDERFPMILAARQTARVHWKWSQRITRLLIQCLESTEYMEIRNALIMLTKISGVFPVTRKSGINLEKRVAKIKSDEREDLKVLATGVAAALAARK
ncbi:THO complex subunit, partial [Sesamum angolense]